MLFKILLYAILVAASPSPYSRLSRRVADFSESALEVDLGYSIYRGWYNASANLNVFQGIRYGQDTSGNLRWQPPRAPETNRSAVILADSFGSQCPQSPDASSSYTAVDNSASSEDCLFLNVVLVSTGGPPNADTAQVYAPAANNVTAGDATEEPGLPVWVWIHGGGYGEGSGAYDLTALITTNGNRFVGVDINYRLGAFGFLASDEVYQKGVVNAGILDQQMALQWVQQYIHLFGGNNRKVTIFGESAGAGSVMLHDIAYGGTLGTSLFRNSITASPFLAYQYGYKDWQPSQAYYAFASAAGCDVKDAYLHNGSKPVFQCLIETDSATLINASASVSQSGTWGTWAFLPVTDGELIQERPSKQLLEGRINGENHLAGHNALEGALWTPSGITTIDDLVQYLRIIFPNFSNNDIAKVLFYYPSSNASVNPSALDWATEGSYGPTTINESTAATGQQERAIAIRGESTFICPSYWLAEAYSNNGNGGQAWKYQFSIPNAYHGADGAGYFSWPYSDSYYNADFIIAFMTMLGNFIVDNNPSVASAIDNGITTGNDTYNPVSHWPPYSIYAPYMMDFNTTCPHIKEIGGLPYCTGPGEENTFRLANAYTWEGGRGVRCDFWRSMGGLKLQKKSFATYWGQLSPGNLGTTLRQCAELDNQSTGSAAAFHLAKFWMNECLNNHKECRASSRQPGFLPTRLVDVAPQGGDQTIRLVETASLKSAGSGNQYAALSHCWGSKAIIVTDSSNLDAHRQSIPKLELSKTFREAIYTTRKLGLRYIWIDSLCIVQDSHDDWLHESSQMSKIYQEAQVTIAAAHAQNGLVGCFYKRDGVSSVPFELAIPTPSVSPNASLHLLFEPYPDIRYVGTDHPLLYSRAWVFQEQVLSPRMLIFDGAAIRWECLTMYASDVEPSGGIVRQRDALKRIRLRMNSPSLKLSEYNPDQHAEDWRSAVMEFTHRGMTKFSDRLIAIAGIAQAIQMRTKATYLAGLWQDQLLLDMLWCVPFDREYDPEMRFSIPERSREVSPVAPTWSWASTNLPIYYTDSQKLEPVCKIIDANINGDLSRVTGYLTLRGHTRKVYVRSIYSSAFKKAATASRDFVVEPLERVEYGMLDFHPYHHFLASVSKPGWFCPKRAFKLVPGTWKPEEILDPAQPITFIAVAERPRAAKGYNLGTAKDAREVFTMGLVPISGQKDVYRRVGYAQWDFCSWYGYDCGPEDLSPSASLLTRLEHRFALLVHNLKLWSTNWKLSVFEIPLVTTRRLPNGLVFVRKFRCPWLCPGRGQHQHPVGNDDPFPAKNAYHESIDVECKTVTII
ncbi:hypothetical protein MBLNU459_g0175t2 [Dothideomycetes sp. NU459]